jgi:alpha-beta hydrolase superfamily lysophospholipase
VKEQTLLRLADLFTGAGFAVLVHDHRTFGASDGTPRQDIDPWKQIEDWRRALTYLEVRPEVDADRIACGDPATPADTPSCSAPPTAA